MRKRDKFVRAIFAGDVERYREGRVRLIEVGGAFVPAIRGPGVLDDPKSGVSINQSLGFAPPHPLSRTRVSRRGSSRQMLQPEQVVALIADGGALSFRVPINEAT
jgi:hypothetical protein